MRTSISLLIALAFLATASSGCASAPRKDEPTTPGVGPESSQPLPGPVVVPPENTADNYGPQPISYRSVVLVLGPGLARGYSYVGAIRALTEAKIPIAAILGSEMGALVGALYAMEANINRFEWALLKFREGTFEVQGSLLPEVFKKSSRTKKLEEGLEGVFAGRDLNQTKLPVRIAIQVGNLGAAIVDSGPAAQAVRAAIADPDLFAPGKWNGTEAASAGKTRPLLIAEAKAMNLGPVVVIDAMDEVEERKLVPSEALKEADLVIRPDLAGIGPLDFKKRTDAIFKGKTAVKNQMAEIRHLVGLPAEPEPPKESR